MACLGHALTVCIPFRRPGRLEMLTFGALVWCNVQGEMTEMSVTSLFVSFHDHILGITDYTSPRKQTKQVRS